MAARRISRLGISEYLLLLTLEKGPEALPNDETQFLFMKKAMKQLQNITVNALRIGDVVSRYSQFQLTAILPTCTRENAEIVVKRIMTSFYREYRHRRVTVRYNFEEVKLSGSSIIAGEK